MQWALWGSILTRKTLRVCGSFLLAEEKTNIEGRDDISDPAIVNSREVPNADVWAPIPLTPFESMMLVDDRPGSSMSCAAEFHFDGVIRRRLFDVAYDSAIRRHKLLCAVVSGDGHRQEWIPARSRSRVSWEMDSALDEFAEMRSFDLSKETGFRAWVNTEGDKSVLRFDFHHACCDAAGGMAFVEDIFSIYDGLIHSCPPKLRPLDDRRLLGRNQIAAPGESIADRIYRTYVGISKSIRLACTHPRAIPPTGTPEQAWTDRYIIRRLSESDLVSLRYAASDAAATLNDLLLVEFMCLLRDWVQQEHRSISRHDHVRIISPMNLRDRDDATLPAANKIGFGFLSRSLAALQSADTDDWNSFITSVHAEMKKARQLRLPAQFLKNLGVARKSFKLFAHCFSENRCWATGIMTQLGDPTRRFFYRFPRRNGRILVGNLLLTEFISSAPLRPLTRALLSVNTYGNEMTLTLRCDPATIHQSIAEEVMDDFLARLMARCGKKTQIDPAGRAFPRPSRTDVSEIV